MINDSERLIEAYIDNELQDADCQTLCSWLQEDRANANRFIRACFLHWQLFAIGQRRSLQNGVNDRPRQTALAELNSARVENRSRAVGVVARARARLGSRALAATLLIACSLGAWLLVRAWQNETVAQLTKTTADAAWADASIAPRSGAFLRSGQLVELHRGRVLATLSSGVQILVQGPATFRIDAGDSMFLQIGRITVTVPRQASGFVVESPMARFVDLGTEFTLDMQPGSGCELHVFSGLVEMQPSEVRRADQLRVPEGRAIKYDAVSGAVETLTYDPGDRMSL